MSGTYVFVIVGRQDNPIYEAELQGSGKKDIPVHLSHFVLHSSLDVVEELVWRNPSFFMKVMHAFFH